MGRCRCKGLPLSRDPPLAMSVAAVPAALASCPPFPGRSSTLWICTCATHVSTCWHTQEAAQSLILPQGVLQQTVGMPSPSGLVEHTIIYPRALQAAT